MIEKPSSFVDIATVSTAEDRGSFRLLSAENNNDGKILCDLYSSVTNKAALTNWCGAKNGNGSYVNGPCSTGAAAWTRVTCSVVGGATRVTEIDLGNLNLGGTIPISIGGLTQLISLSLQSNSFSGKIPSAVGNLTALEQFHLGFNRFNGSIPSTIGAMTNLKDITLYYNSLSGPIPSTIGALTKLKFLGLNDNSLSGEIPAAIWGTVSLESLLLSSNSLNGSIPSAIANLTNLQFLDLGANKFFGQIPSAVSALTKLRYLNIGGNSLNGSIPSSVGALTNLYALTLGPNALSGQIPSAIGILTKLTSISLNGASLSGSVPASFCSLHNKTQINIYSNPLLTCYPSCLNSFTWFYKDAATCKASNNCSIPSITFPTGQPTGRPTAPSAPTQWPIPTRQTTKNPSAIPSVSPTPAPTITPAPTSSRAPIEPSAVLTNEPTRIPTPATTPYLEPSVPVPVPPFFFTYHTDKQCRSPAYGAINATYLNDDGASQALVLGNCLLQRGTRAKFACKKMKNKYTLYKKTFMVDDIECTSPLRVTESSPATSEIIKHDYLCKQDKEVQGRFAKVHCGSEEPKTIPHVQSLVAPELFSTATCNRETVLKLEEDVAQRWEAKSHWLNVCTPHYVARNLVYFYTLTVINAAQTSGMVLVRHRYSKLDPSCSEAKTKDDRTIRYPPVPEVLTTLPGCLPDPLNAGWYYLNSKATAPRIVKA